MLCIDTKRQQGLLCDYRLVDFLNVDAQFCRHQNQNSHVTWRLISRHANIAASSFADMESEQSFCNVESQ